MVAQRKRKRSESDLDPHSLAQIVPSTFHASASQPLTIANLSRLNRLAMPSTPKTPSTPQRGRSPTKNAFIDNRKLQAYRISDVESRRKPLPHSLQVLVNTISERSGEAPPSLRAEKFLAKQAAGEKRREDDSMHGVARLLYLHPLWWDGDDEFIDATCNHNLTRGFLPDAPNQTATELGALENPRPDLLFGYMHSEIAKRLETRAVLSENEELLVVSRRLAVSDVVAFPFLSAQLKSATSGGSIPEAERQTRRDGAAIVRANHTLFELAGSAHPPLASLCHFSSTSDTKTAHLYLHYQEHDPDMSEYPMYRTHIIYSCLLHDEEGVKGWRTRMRGIYDWAVGTRLAFFKDLIHALANTTGVGPGRDDESTTTATGESLSTCTESVSTTTSLRRPVKRSVVVETLAQATQRSEQWPTFTPPQSEVDMNADDEGNDDGIMAIKRRRK